MTLLLCTQPLAGSPRSLSLYNVGFSCAPEPLYIAFTSHLSAAVLHCAQAVSRFPDPSYAAASVSPTRGWRVHKPQPPPNNATRPRGRCVQDKYGAGLCVASTRSVDSRYRAGASSAGQNGSRESCPDTQPAGICGVFMG